MEDQQLQHVQCQYSTYSADCISNPCNDGHQDGCTIGSMHSAKKYSSYQCQISTHIRFAQPPGPSSCMQHGPHTKPSERWPQVQCGFGRVGSHFWGFELQSVVPDMVTLGKPIGNGFPMGAVVMTPKLAQGFSNGMEYFNTCGGCTGAAAAGQHYQSYPQ